MSIILPKLMTVESIQHFNQKGKCIWEAKDLPNVFHLEGQRLVLENTFDTDGDLANVPTSFYLGLDNRTSTNSSDTLSSLSGEPSSNGYSRISISSSTGFIVGQSGSSMKATSSVHTFLATSGSWGPVKNVFLSTTASGTSGVLMASVALGATRTPSAGESIGIKISISL